jgi:hypothetical protein
MAKSSDIICVIPVFSGSSGRVWNGVNGSTLVGTWHVGIINQACSSGVTICGPRTIVGEHSVGDIVIQGDHRDLVLKVNGIGHALEVLNKDGVREEVQGPWIPEDDDYDDLSDPEDI